MKSKKLFADFILKSNLANCVADNRTLKDYTTIKIGGPATFFVEPTSIKELQRIFLFVCKNVLPYKIIGNGSNLLISDRGYDGIIFSLKRMPLKMKIIDNSFSVPANVSTKNMLKKCVQSGINGLEFLTGIPGSIGGIIEMNAGAFDHSIGDVVKEIIIINENGELEKIKAEEIIFKYRMADIKRKNYLIIKAIFNIKKVASDKIQSLCKEYFNRRSSKNLLDTLTFGSVFKNGKDYFAGKLIEKCGLKGYRIGDAQISRNHANFIINLGSATSKEVFELIKLMKQKVQEKFSEELTPEVRFWGDFFK